MHSSVSVNHRIVSWRPESRREAWSPGSKRQMILMRRWKPASLELRQKKMSGGITSPSSCSRLAYLRRAGDEVALVVVRFGLRGGEIELPHSTGAWRVVLSSHDLAAPRVGSRVAMRPIEAIIVQRVPHTIHG